MDRLRQLAFVSVGRGCGFVGLGIATVMAGLCFSPVMMMQAGAILASILAAALALMALRAPRRDPRRTEVWLMLEPSEVPPPAVARRIVGGVLAETYRRFAQWAAAFAAVLWAGRVILALAGV